MYGARPVVVISDSKGMLAEALTSHLKKSYTVETLDQIGTSAIKQRYGINLASVVWFTESSTPFELEDFDVSQYVFCVPVTKNWDSTIETVRTVVMRIPDLCNNDAESTDRCLHVDDVAEAIAMAIENRFDLPSHFDLTLGEQNGRAARVLGWFPRHPSSNKSWK